jgi:hypothetical protein
MQAVTATCCFTHLCHTAASAGAGHIMPSGSSDAAAPALTHFLVSVWLPHAILQWFSTGTPAMCTPAS